MKKFTTEEINVFLNGKDPMERIVNIECSYTDEKVSIIYVNKKGNKMIKFDDFKPFVWAKNSVAVRMFGGDRETLKLKMAEYGVGVKKLQTSYNDSESPDRLENGYKYIFYAKRPMSFQKFLMFFQMAKTPIYDTKKKKDINEKTVSNREFLSVSPVEQYMIASGKRFFKGYESYDETKRLQFDLETEGLNPEVHAINQIGVRTNRGFEKIITVVGQGEERRINELQAIIDFLEILSEEKPDVVIGHNSENFDWNFIIVRCQQLGTTLEELSKHFFRNPIYKKNKESVLKLGGEVEYYKPTIMWGTSIIDSLHAVRRAQAIDSSMKLASLKYVTKYLNLTKPNRVYVPGNQISDIWNDKLNQYAFNNENGDWYKITNEYPLKENYNITTGKYIVERYLLDDLWETDKIELKLNESNFLINKILPTTFQRACTMGTAGIWKLITLAWCYENNLAVPSFGTPKRFTGGLSRLLKVGYADRVVKLDYNSLYPSIILTWNIASDLDISNALLMMLEFVLSEREKYKDLKGVSSKKAKKLKDKLANETLTDDEIVKIKEDIAFYQADASANDKKQLPLKILANSFFGSFGAPDVFPLGDVKCAEMTTCIGRQSLRLMISHFTNLGYTPIVGDSVTSDTPLFIKYKNSNLIDIRPIGKIFNKFNYNIDELGREYDYSEKYYQVYCRSGWRDVEYVYRHSTDKSIYKVSEGDMTVCVTEDHSLFDENQNEIKPTDIKSDTKLEYANKPKQEVVVNKYDKKQIKIIAKMVADGSLTQVPVDILNSSNETKKLFMDEFNKIYDGKKLSKTCLAGLNYIKI